MELNSMYLAALLIDDSTATASQPALSRDALSCNTTASSYSRFILWNAVAARWLMRAAGKTDCDATVTCLSTVLAAHCMIPSSPITPSTTAMTLVFMGPESVSRDCGARPCIPCIGWHSFWSAPVRRAIRLKQRLALVGAAGRIRRFMGVVYLQCAVTRPCGASVPYCSG